MLFFPIPTLPTVIFVELVKAFCLAFHVFLSDSDTKLVPDGKSSLSALLLKLLLISVLV